MKFYLIGFLLCLNFHSAFAKDDVMEACGSAMDIAESNLRILLSKPAQGSIPKEWKNINEIKEASKRLLRVELLYPGCMRGDYGKSDWDQYKTVRGLFAELMGHDEALDAKQINTNEKKELETCKNKLTTLENNEPKVFNGLLRNMKQITDGKESSKGEQASSVSK